jgi:hypothetical protein
LFVRLRYREAARQEQDDVKVDPTRLVLLGNPDELRNSPSTLAPMPNAFHAVTQLIGCPIDVRTIRERQEHAGQSPPAIIDGNAVMVASVAYGLEQSKRTPFRIAHRPRFPFRSLPRVLCF